MDWIFDMDGTLYSPLDHVWERTLEQMGRYFIQTLRLPITGTQEEQDQLRAKWHTRQTLIAYVNEFDLDFETIVKDTHLPIIEHLNIWQREGADQIQALPGKKWVLTNSPEIFAIALLQKLELDQVFDGVFGIRKDMHTAKPEPKSYLRVPVGSQVIIVDDWHDNLLVPFQFGWKTVWFPEENVPRPSETPHYVHHEIRSFAELQKLVS